MKVTIQFNEDEVAAAKCALSAPDLYSCLAMSAKQIEDCLKNDPEGALVLLAELRDEFLLVINQAMD